MWSQVHTHAKMFGLPEWRFFIQWDDGIEEEKVILEPNSLNLSRNEAKIRIWSKITAFQLRDGLCREFQKCFTRPFEELIEQILVHVPEEELDLLRLELEKSVLSLRNRFWFASQRLMRYPFHRRSKIDPFREK